MYFDREGKVIESSEKRMEGVPLVKGLDFGYVVLGRTLPVSNSFILGSVMGVTQQLDLYDIASDSIYYNENNHTISVTLTGGDIEVSLGQDEEMAAKLSALNDMLPEIRARGLKGTLDLSSYTDSDKGSVNSFKVKTLEK